MAGLVGSNRTLVEKRARRLSQQLLGAYQSVFGFGLTLVDGKLGIDDEVFVPYVGATKDVDLGTYDLSATALHLPETTDSSTGLLTLNSTPFLHYYGDNLFVGPGNGNFTLTGNANCVFGIESFTAAEGAIGNLVLGWHCATSLTDGNYNIIGGYGTADELTTGNNNIIWGNNSATRLQIGNNNVIAGFSCCTYITSTSNAVIMGYNAGDFATALDSCTIIGNSALIGTLGTQGDLSDVTAIGKNALADVQVLSPGDGSYTTAVGSGAGQYNRSGIGGSFLGFHAGASSFDADYGTYVGYNAGDQVTGHYVVCLGTNSGRQATGNYGIFIGTQNMDTSGSAARSIHIGYRAGRYDATDDRLYIANSDTSTLIYGEFDNKLLRVDGDLEVYTGEEFRLYETDNTNYSGFVAPTLSANLMYTLPDAFPTANSQAMLSATDGTLSWGTDFGANNIVTTGTVSASTYYVTGDSLSGEIFMEGTSDVDMTLYNPNAQAKFTVRVVDVGGDFDIFQLDANLNSVKFLAGVASGSGSFACCGTASGSDAIAIGTSTTATHLGSVAIGYNSDAIANYAVTLGRLNTSSGQYAVSAGYNTTSSGQASFAAGTGVTASGNSSVAFGSGTTAAAFGSFVCGSSSSVSSGGVFGIAMGLTASVTGFSGIAIGNSCNATNSYAVAIGNGCTASGNGSVSIGYGSTATSTYSVAIGWDNDSSGQGSVAMGNDTSATANGAVAMGNGNGTALQASGIGSLACGGIIAGSGGDGYIYSTASGCFTFGYAQGGTNTNDSTVESTETGAFAIGAATSTGVTPGGHIQSAGIGSFAGGRANGGEIFALGNGSIAFGFSGDGELIKAGESTSDYGAIAIGSGNTQALGICSVAIGEDVVASNAGDNIISIGENFTNTNDSTFGIGFGALDFLFTATDFKILQDNHKFILGAGDDLEIYHDATDNLINSKTGSLKLQHNGTTRIETNGTGIGVFGAAPAAKPAAYTQTYASTSRTNNALASSTLTDSTGGTANTTLVAISGTGDDANVNNNFADLAAQVNNLVSDVTNAKQLLNTIIDDLQSFGWFA